MKKKDIIFLAILIITIFGLYWKTFNYELIWDSKIYFKQNLLLSENYPIWSAFKIGYLREQLGLNSVDFYYRPLLTASYMIENKLWGLQATTLRLVNLIIYITSLIFLFVFLKNQSEKKYFPEIATFLFALYPLNVDNIVWIVGRGDLLLLLWGTLTFLFLEFFIKKGKYFFLIGSSFFYLLGIFSKESFLFFLPILFIYEIIKRKKIFVPYHLTNAFLTIFLFILKNKILGIKNLGLIPASSFSENIGLAIGALGYYIRTIIFPIYYDMFLPIYDAMNLLFLGIIAILIFIYFLVLSKKDKEILVPLCFILVFLGGHILLVYSSLYPFKLYSRYMIIPSLGVVWIFTKYISQIKEKIRLILVLILLLLFIPSIILNASSYKSELNFFQRANKANPKNSYILFQVANALHEKKEYLTAELFLNSALQYRQRKGTAMLVSLLYADLEIARADYEKVSKWLESVEDFESYPHVQLSEFMKYQINHKRALIYMLQGNTDPAEKLLEEEIKKNKNLKGCYLELYYMYIGQNMWEKAINLEKIMKKRFPSLRSLDTAKLEREFNSLSNKGKIGFYIHYRNFRKAINLIQTMPTLDIEHTILLSKLYYWEGEGKEAVGIINEILSEYPDDFKVLNTIGNFYLMDMIRVQEALFYFKKSLEINKGQPEIEYLVNYLTDEYLKKLKDVWSIELQPDTTQDMS